MLNELKTIYQDYNEKAMEVRRKAPIFAGWLGLGSDPRKHPCHEEFYDATIRWTENFVAGQPSQEAVMEVASFVLETPVKFRDYDAYWFMFVAIGNIRPLVPLMAKEDCKALVKRFDELYKKHDRLPLQRETYKILAKAAK